MIYKNVEVDNGIKKIPFLRKQMLTKKWDALVILGAQDHDDVRYLCRYARKKKMYTMLFDRRQTQLDAAKYADEKILEDLSNISLTKGLICKLKERGSKNPFIYDNLCGGRSRDDHVHLFINAFPFLISYMSARNNRMEEIKDITIDSVHYTRGNHVVLLSKQKE